MRAATGSQWRVMKHGVAWAVFSWPRTTHGAESGPLAEVWLCLVEAQPEVSRTSRGKRWPLPAEEVEQYTNTRPDRVTDATCIKVGWDLCWDFWCQEKPCKWIVRSREAVFIEKWRPSTDPCGTSLRRKRNFDSWDPNPCHATCQTWWWLVEQAGGKGSFFGWRIISSCL